MTLFWLTLALGFLAVIAFNGWLLFQGHRSSLAFRRGVVEEWNRSQEEWRRSWEESSTARQQVEVRLESAQHEADELRREARLLDELRRDVWTQRKPEPVYRPGAIGDVIGSYRSGISIAIITMVKQPAEEWKYTSLEAPSELTLFSGSYRQGDGKLAHTIKREFSL